MCIDMNLFGVSRREIALVLTLIVISAASFSYGVYVGGKKAPPYETLKDIYESVFGLSSGSRVEMENVVSAENYSFEPVDNGNFTIGVLPDTQIYSRSYPKVFDNIVRWIIGHESTWNIEFVSQEGDLVQNYSDSTEWKNARGSMRKLDNHIPYGFLAGNHDKGPSQAADMMNRYFRCSYYEGNWGENWWGGCYWGTKNNYQLISVPEMDLLFLHLEYNPSDRVLDWAGRVLDNYPKRFGVITTHSYLGLDGSRTESGERIWNELISRYSNVRLVLCGHVHGEAKSTVVEDNRVINQVLADYQVRNNGGNGWIRLLTFNPDENLIQVRTYSPFLRMFETDKDSQFQLRWN